MRWVGDLVPPAPSARRFLVIRRGTIGPRGKFRVEIQVGPTSDDIDTRRTVADQLDDLEAAREAAREHRAKNRVTEWRMREARSAIDAIVDAHGTRPVELILEGEPPSFAGITDNEAAAIRRAAEILGEDELRERAGLDEGDGDGSGVDFPGAALGAQATLDEGADPLAGLIEFVERRRREFGPSTTFSEAIEHLVDVARVLEDTPPDPSEPRIDDLQEAMEALLRRFRRWAEANVSKLASDPGPRFEDLIDALDSARGVTRSTAEVFVQKFEDLAEGPGATSPRTVTGTITVISSPRMEQRNVVIRGAPHVPTEVKDEAADRVTEDLLTQEQVIEVMAEVPPEKEIGTVTFRGTEIASIDLDDDAV